MRILVFSDSHKNISACVSVIENIIGVDMIIHAGDHASDAAWIQKCFPHIPVKYVIGNCDANIAPAEMIIEAENKRIYLTHGHLHSVKSQEDCHSLIDSAVSKSCDCAVFGHTHRGVCFESGGITILNPGSIKHSGTYGVIEIEDGRLKAAVCEAPFSF